MNSNVNLFLRLSRTDGNKVLIAGYPSIPLLESIETVLGKGLFTITKQSMEREEEMVMLASAVG